MGDNRERPVGEVSSGPAWVSVIEGWADPLRTEADYEFAQNSLIKYFTRNVRDLAEARTRDVVAAAVTRFRARWHAGVPVRLHRGVSPWGPSPVELADTVRNAVLDQLGDPSPDDDLDLAGPTEREDELLAFRAVGAKPDVVRKGLAQLVAAAERVNFLIVTQYLDLAEHERTRPPRAVQVVARLGAGVTTEQAVIRAMTLFRERLARISGDV